MSKNTNKKCDNKNQDCACDSKQADCDCAKVEECPCEQKDCGCENRASEGAKKSASKAKKQNNQVEDKFDDMLDDEDGEEILELMSEEGEVVQMYPVAAFQYLGIKYMVFDPVKKSKEFTPGEAVILKTEEEGEDYVYTAIESQELLEEVFAEFLRLQALEEDLIEEQDGEAE